MTLTVRDICNHFGCHEQTVLAWIHSGELKAVNVGVAPGKKKPRWRITQAALEEFEKKRAAVPPAPTPTRRRRKSTDAVDFY